MALPTNGQVSNLAARGGVQNVVVPSNIAGVGAAASRLMASTRSDNLAGLPLNGAKWGAGINQKPFHPFDKGFVKSSPELAVSLTIATPHKDLTDGDVILTRDIDNKNNVKKHVIKGVDTLGALFRHEPPVRGYNLAGMNNEILGRCKERAASKGVMLRGDGVPMCLLDREFLEELVELIKPQGIMQKEAAFSGGDSQKATQVPLQSNSSFGRSGKVNKIVACQRLGMTRMRNLWGRNLPAGRNLHVVLKLVRVAHGDNFVIGLAASTATEMTTSVPANVPVNLSPITKGSNVQPQVNIGGSNQTAAAYVWQLVPIHSLGNQPDADDCYSTCDVLFPAHGGVPARRLDKMKIRIYAFFTCAQLRVPLVEQLYDIDVARVTRDYEYAFRMDAVDRGKLQVNACFTSMRLVYEN